MMNRSTQILLISFLIIGGLTLFYWFQPEDRNSTLLFQERDFAVTDTASIQKIFLADRLGNTTTLERKGKGWLYNTKYPVNQNVIENLLDVINRVKMQFKPPNAAVPNLVESLAREGIKVEIYDRQDELMKAYYIGGSTPDERGTYILVEGAEQPYVASMPGWTGNIRFRYNLLGDDWRDKAIFRAQAEDIQSISINYPLQRSESFKLTREGSGFELRPYYDLTAPSPKAPSPGKIEAFLYLFNPIIAESFINKHPQKDSILQQIPFCEIRLEMKSGEVKEVSFHPRYLPIAPQGGANSSQRIVERYYANVNEEDFMLVQNEVFKKVFWGYAFFFD